MITVETAHALIRNSIPAPRVTAVAAADAAGWVVAKDIPAPFPLPRFDNSAMDGFAVRWEDTRTARDDHPVALKQTGTVPAGIAPSMRVGPGECAQVMTGAPIPPGADAVVMVEYTSGFAGNGVVKIKRPVRKGENIRFAGEETGAGEVVVPAGKRVGAAELGVLAAFGIEQVQAYRRPRLAILVTGSELKKAGETLTEGEIYNSNLPLLRELARLAGGEVVVAGAVPDDPVSLRGFLEKGFESCDILVCSGGVSAGRFDLVRTVFKQLGVKESFHKVAQKPGKPLTFGTMKRILVFGLPGNPVSAFVCFMEYVWPACERWMGLEPQPKISAVLEAGFPRDPRMHRFLPGSVRMKGGKLLASPSRKVGSHMLTSAVGANAILESPPGNGPLDEGETVLVNLLPWKSITGKP
ncbi:MAG: gephyrin-like molybdotransferase Glp [Fidelibacterota bacterium]